MCGLERAAVGYAFAGSPPSTASGRPESREGGRERVREGGGGGWQGSLAGRTGQGPTAEPQALPALKPRRKSGMTAGSDTNSTTSDGSVPTAIVRGGSQSWPCCFPRVVISAWMGARDWPPSPRWVRPHRPAAPIGCCLEASPNPDCSHRQRYLRLSRSPQHSAKAFRRAAQGMRSCVALPWVLGFLTKMASSRRPSRVVLVPVLLTQHLDPLPLYLWNSHHVEFDPTSVRFLTLVFCLLPWVGGLVSYFLH
ncbi:hypothetical protein GQ53DRAFT_67328 [Thozetella sp. PMI_491]|nr:hypothetical protein GQ53DRAFT_67328 [Thozetella sp. PMI_491]